MNTKDFLRLGVPLGEATRPPSPRYGATRRATDFIAQFILGGGDKSRLREEVAAIVANPVAFVADAFAFQLWFGIDTARLKREI